LLPIRLIFTSGGVLYEIEREWTTPFFSFGFEAELPTEKFHPNQLIIVVHNDDWPENIQYQAFGIDLAKCVPNLTDQPLPGGDCWFDGTMEVIFNKRHKVGRVIISPDGIDLYDKQEPFIRYINGVVWIDISGRRIHKMSLISSDQSVWDSIWDGPYRPGQFVRGVMAKSAPVIIWHGAVDVTMTLIDIFPQSAAYATNSFAVGKIARLLFNLFALHLVFVILLRPAFKDKDKDLAGPTIFGTWIVCIMIIQLLLYGF